MSASHFSLDERAALHERRATRTLRSESPESAADEVAWIERRRRAGRLHGHNGANGSISAIAAVAAFESDPWPEPDLSILDDRRGNLPEFPLDTMPVLADW